MKGRATLGVTAAAVLLAAMAFFPALDRTAPDVRDDGAWIEVDDPAAATLALPTVQEALDAPDLVMRLPPAPALRDPGPRGGVETALTAVPEAPEAPVEPAPPALARAGIGPAIAFELPALAAVQLPVPAAPAAEDGPAPNACCPTRHAVAC